jgi:sigma-B regulation protein RsbU (phosphoserine phosphatase)
VKAAAPGGDHLDAGAETPTDKLARFKTITDSALSQLGVEDLLTELLARTRDLLDADSATVFLLNSAGTELVATAASGLEEEVRIGLRIPVGTGFAGHVAASGKPRSTTHVNASTVTSPVLLAAGVSALLGVPLLRAGAIAGVLQVGSIAPRTFNADDIELLQLTADRAAVVVQDRTARLDRATAVALQRSLLPDQPDPIAGLDLATRYIPGAAHGVGGDWYDLFDLPDGHIGITIGDVAGNGLRAAVVMGRIHSALRAYALESLDPADVLTRLDRKIRRFEPDAMATVLYAVLDPDHAQLRVSNAGHPPPVLRIPEHPNELLDVPVDVPVGAFAGRPRHTTAVPLPAGSAILLYTDGLVETRDTPVTDGIETLRSHLAGDTADRMCLTAMRTMLAHREATDDIALLALRRR